MVLHCGTGPVFSCSPPPLRVCRPCSGTGDRRVTDRVPAVPLVSATTVLYTSSTNRFQNRQTRFSMLYTHTDNIIIKGGIRKTNLHRLLTPPPFLPSAVWAKKCRFSVENSLIFLHMIYLFQLFTTTVQCPMCNF